MATKAQQDAYAKRLERIAAEHVKIEDATIRRLLSMLKELRQQIAAELLEAEGWEAYRLNRLQSSIEDYIRAYDTQARALFREAERQAWELGSHAALEPLQEGGFVGAAIGVLPSTELLLVTLDFGADLIGGLTTEMRDNINTQLRLSLLGQRSALETMKEVTRILGLDARTGVWKARRDPVKGVAARAETIVRTETHRAYNMAHNAHQQDLAQLVPDLLKRWVSAGDTRVRATHLSAHIYYMDNPIPVTEPFIVGGAALMFPGDPAGPASETINCRCRPISVAPEIAGVEFGMDKIIKAEVARRKSEGEENA